MLRLCAVRIITSVRSHSFSTLSGLHFLVYVLIMIYFYYPQTDLSQLDVYPSSLSSKPRAYAEYTWTPLMTSFTNLNDSHGVSYLALTQG